MKKRNKAISSDQNSQIRACSLPGCGVTFKSKNNFHRFHSKECKKEWELRIYLVGKMAGELILNGYAQKGGLNDGKV